MKECNNCKIEKPVTEFYLTRKVCKDCLSKRNKKNRLHEPFKTNFIEPILGELWEPIKGLEKFYRISSFGRITSLCKSAYGKPWPRKNEKLLKQQLNSFTGYYCYVFSKWGDGKDIRYNIHKLVATHFIENPNNLPEINHINGNKLDNIVSNLEWVTREDNIRHAFINGLIKPKKGESSHNCTLTNEQVLHIYNSKVGPRQLSRDLKMPYSKIASIRNGVSWNHITGAPKKYYGKDKNRQHYTINCFNTDINTQLT